MEIIRLNIDGTYGLLSFLFEYLVYFSLDYLLSFLFPFLMLSLATFQIANYFPLDEDLDYPAKLERSATNELETTAVRFLRCPFLPFMYI